MPADILAPTGPGVTAAVGPFEVTADRIAEFADATGDPNPVYRDRAAARALGHPDVVAPPTFAVRLAAGAELPVLNRHPLGYDYTSATHLSQDYRHLRPIRAGDVLTARGRLVEAREALGGGLVTVEVTVTDRAGSAVTVSTARILSRRPLAGEAVRAALAELIGREDFVCLGAKAALRRDRITHRHGGEPASPEAVRTNLDALRTFLDSFEPGAQSFSSFVMTFDRLPDTSEQTFEQTVWRHLQALHDEDSRHHPWTGLYDSDPASPRFALSLFGHPFFVVGLHPGASRPSRRFALPALVFNSHLQFNALGRTFFKMRKKIRERDDTLHGSANPSLLTYRDEARHYSGRMTEQSWACPFTARTGD
ncbi:guanitoxin biosynthesis heme-dependent pre-guanitoxin N-hydroxylase GntA [Streptomyces sp. NPDC059468]|uniref:guanitoxin biosynthesis heme-dependent pre-guanitoxin N-hydroxylase GntA n=1 Tax=Streptomyces sp. NPDC059468 TaxID=3346845 RepID=UPI00368F5D6A